MNETQWRRFYILYLAIRGISDAMEELPYAFGGYELFQASPAWRMEGLYNDCALLWNDLCHIREIKPDYDAELDHLEQRIFAAQEIYPLEKLKL